MTVPIRIQRERTRGYKMPPNTVSVTRPGAFGNHYRVWRDDDRQWTVSWHGCHYTPGENTKVSAAALAVELYSKDVMIEGPQNHRGVDPIPTHADIIKALRGKNLACFCKPGEPCHADVLLKIANAPFKAAEVVNG